MYLGAFYPPWISLSLIVSKFSTCGNECSIKLFFSILSTKTLSL
nr:MAG TPA: hypothetical protein [Caudoviricetes sp.]